jgi:hypothetical protein
MSLERSDLKGKDYPANSMLPLKTLKVKHEKIYLAIP